MFNIILVDTQHISYEFVQNISENFNLRLMPDINLDKNIYNLDYYAVWLQASTDIQINLLKQIAQQYNFDILYSEQEFSLKNIKVMAMDMDSTLITCECIDEIAALIGVKQQVAHITELTMQGHIFSFDESLKQRVGFLKGMDVNLLDTLYANINISKGAENLIKVLRQHNIYTLLLSGGFTFIAEKLQQRFNFNEMHANVLEIIHEKLSGKVLGDIINAQSKANLLKDAMYNNNINDGQSLAIGDGANDIPMMQAADFSLAFKGKSKVQNIANFSINKCGMDAILFLDLLYKKHKYIN